MMKKAILVLLTLTISLSTIHAQEVIPASGGNASGSGGTVSYTVGQMVYSTNSGINGSMAEGVQQPFEISEVIGIKEAKINNPEISVFPNPTNDFLILKIDVSTPLNIRFLYYQIYDINGKLLESKKLADYETTISTANLVSGIYFLKITDENKEIKTFKIVKNH